MDSDLDSDSKLACSAQFAGGYRRLVDAMATVYNANSTVCVLNQQHRTNSAAVSTVRE